MGEVVQFIRKPDPDRAARLIQEARAIYESIFPTEIASTARQSGMTIRRADLFSRKMFRWTPVCSQ